MTVTRKFILADVACCILTAAQALCTEFGWTPAVAGVSPKGGDWECAGLYVVPSDSRPADITPNTGGPSLHTWRFTVEAAVCVNESLSCQNVGSCCDLPAHTDPCTTPFPSRSAEARFLLGLRYTLVRGLAADVRNILGCGIGCDGLPLGIRCTGVNVAETTVLTEGGFHFISIVIEATW
jgi:hypothetical protein